MPQKIPPSPPAQHRSRSAALPKTADPATEKLLQYLADTPALTAAQALANMLLDTEDSTTRLAIMRTRIQVLRARTIACQLGQPVAGNITLGEVFAYQARPDHQIPTHGTEPLAPDIAPKADTPLDTDPADEPVKVRLLKTYTHEGIELPKGGVFLVSAHSVGELAERGICEVLDAPQLAENGNTDSDSDSDEDEDVK